jgi:hypothetical protein
MRRLLMLLAPLLLSACGGETVKFYLTDAPLTDAAEVNVTLHGLTVFSSSLAEGNVPGSGGTIVFEEPMPFDLLEVKEVPALLGEIAADGFIQMIELKVGSTATIVYQDGSSREAFIPSGIETGVKIVGPFDLAGENEVVLDFDAELSFYEAEDGSLVMNPTIRVIIGGQVVGESEPLVP